MKWSAVTILLGILFISQNSPVFSQPPEQVVKENFSVKGTITEINPNQQIIKAKNEGGLELTFSIIATTEILEGEQAKLLADLAPGDNVEIKYVYDDNYEKIARLIRKGVKTVSV